MGTILVIDDDKFITEIIARFLNKHNHEVLKVHKGKEGIKIAIDTLPDVILLDQVMPDIEGTAVCETLKNDERTKDIPIVFVTSKVELDDQVQALRLGAHDYICKPIEPKELIARVEAALRIKYLQDQLKDKLRISQELEETRQHLLEQYMNSMFGQLAESLMHELNNPLMAVIGLAELVKGRGLSRDNQLLSHMEMIRDMGLRASAKLNSLLCIAKDEGSSISIDVNKIVKDVVELVNAHLLIAGVELNLILQDNIKEIKGNQSQIARAILALINNAIEATEKSSDISNKKIAVHTSQLPTGEVSIKVYNFTGHISEDIKEKLFQPFFTTKKSNYHAGLGLYFVQNIAKDHKGHINWESTLENTWFEVVLPVNL
ncbi:MAG: response regulator [Blastocatellia bacterium]|nr:response regulator [Blastocatellia bacterium]MBN8725351.1 response regulator [Acidobacteriota bacterium]